MEEDDVKHMEEERWKCMMYEWNGGVQEEVGVACMVCRGRMTAWIQQLLEVISQLA